MPITPPQRENCRFIFRFCCTRLLHGLGEFCSVIKIKRPRKMAGWISHYVGLMIIPRWRPAKAMFGHMLPGQKTHLCACGVHVSRFWVSEDTPFCIGSHPAAAPVMEMSIFYSYRAALCPPTGSLIDFKSSPLFRSSEPSGQEALERPRLLFYVTAGRPEGR